LIRISRLILISASLIVLVAACTAAPAAQNLTSTQWKLTTLNGKAPVTTNKSLTLNFDSNDQVSGHSGCNSYGGDYTANGNALSFSKVFSTLMACPGEGIDEQESAFHQALSQVTTFEISNGQLNLKNANGSVLLVFSKA
jgi:heat shock protein HslJ